ncbi:hypothetical protein ACFW9F_16255 [Streptomyces sp. NPDC059506]|uniref:hypothetical protein n=1 Tax=Streptomyces sp. NPDC059506 TaxID=3347751 RepID=UPI003687024E
MPDAEFPRTLFLADLQTALEAVLTNGRAPVPLPSAVTFPAAPEPDPYEGENAGPFAPGHVWAADRATLHYGDETRPAPDSTGTMVAVALVDLVGDEEPCPGEVLRVDFPLCDCGCDPTPSPDISAYDTESSVSRQHRIDTGRYLRPGEALLTVG